MLVTSIFSCSHIVFKRTVPQGHENTRLFSKVLCLYTLESCNSNFLQSRLANERLQVLKVYHPFVCGPHNQTIRQLMDETGAKINVPPPSVMKDEIVVSGEKEGVMKCKATIMAIYEEKVGITLLS